MDVMTHPLLDAIKREFKLSSDSELAKFIGDHAAQISNFRHLKKKIGATVVLKIHKATGWPISAIEALIPPQP